MRRHFDVSEVISTFVDPIAALSVRIGACKMYSKTYWGNFNIIHSVHCAFINHLHIYQHKHINFIKLLHVPAINRHPQGGVNTKEYILMSAIYRCNM